VPAWLQAASRRVLFRFWKKVVLSKSRTAAGLGMQTAFAETIDVFHHPSGVFFPPHGRANVLTLHDLIPLTLPQYCGADVIKWFHDAYLAYLDQMDIILCNSTQTKRDAVDLLGVDEETLHVTPLAAHERYRPVHDRDHLRSVLARHGLEGRPYILNISTLMPHKNHERLVEAFDQLRRAEPCLDHQLVLVGYRAWQHERTFAAIHRLRLEPHVKWLGYVETADLPALLTGADLFAFPSLYEGFGLPALEAMACGTPVVASNTSSLPEVVGDAGLLIDPLRVDALAEAMHRVLMNRPLQATLRQKGLVRAQLFSWEKTAQLTLAAYEEAAKRSRGRGRRPPRKYLNTPLQRKRRREAIDRLRRQHGI
jgi:glycosyltransferase involved in cell wall biosynthesis